jgi:hypothetical protein
MKHTLLYCLILISLIACQKKVDEQPPDVPTVPTKVTLSNPGFESNLSTGWKIETAYTGMYGFKQDTAAKIAGNYGLSFYAAQPNHWPGNPQETPWNGKIYQTVNGLKKGTYTIKLLGLALGTGMFIYANGGGSDVKISFRTDQIEAYQFDVDVTAAGTLNFGCICINAGGAQMWAPYFHADEFELWTK